MTDRKKHIGLLLLTLFVAGSQVAPLSHYLFMVLSGAHVAVRSSSAHRFDHTLDAGSHSRDSPRFGKVHHSDLCGYGDLFAHFAAAPTQISSNSEREARPGILFVAGQSVVGNFSDAYYLTRGPPHV